MIDHATTEETTDADVARHLAVLAETESQIRAVVRKAFGLLVLATVFVALLAWSVYALMSRRATLESNIAQLETQKQQLAKSFDESVQQKSDETAEKEALQERLQSVNDAVTPDAAPAVAVAQVKEALSPPSTSARALWLEGYNAYRSGNKVAAKNYYERSRAADPNYAPALNSLGRLASEKNDNAGAAALYRQALAADPNYLPALSNLAATDLAAGNFDEAQSLATKANQIRPGYGKPLLDEIGARRATAKGPR